jgi:hypothetical protein
LHNLDFAGDVTIQAVEELWRVWDLVQEHAYKRPLQKQTMKYKLF